jgi:hypothetical protein
VGWSNQIINAVVVNVVNLVVSALAKFLGGLAIGSWVYWMPPSEDETGATDTANYNAAVLAGYSWIILYGAAYYFTDNNTLSDPGPGRQTRGAGMDATTCYAIGTTGGDLVCISSTVAPPASPGGGWTNMTLDDSMWTGTPGALVLLHFGDITDYEIDHVRFRVTHGNYALHLDNRFHWTERHHGRRWYDGCFMAVVFDVANQLGIGAGATAATADASFAGYDCYDAMASCTYGFVINSGANVYGARWMARGNFGDGDIAGVYLNGEGPAGFGNEGHASQINTSELLWDMECAAGPITPQNILFGAASNVIQDCYGVINFAAAGNNWSPSNYPGGGSFFGPIKPGANAADALPGLARLRTTMLLGGGLTTRTSGAAAALSNGSTISTASPGALVTNSGNVTGIIMEPGSGYQDQQVLVVTNIGSGSVTFAATASNVADGNSDVIAAGTARIFAWNNETGLWYRTQ